MIVSVIYDEENLLVKSAITIDMLDTFYMGI